MQKPRGGSVSGGQEPVTGAAVVVISENEYMKIHTFELRKKRINK